MRKKNPAQDALVHGSLMASVEKTLYQCGIDVMCDLVLSVAPRPPRFPNRPKPCEQAFVDGRGTQQRLVGKGLVEITHDGRHLGDGGAISSTRVGTRRGLIARLASGCCSPLPRSTATSRTFESFSVRKISTRREFGEAVEW